MTAVTETPRFEPPLHFGVEWHEEAIDAHIAAGSLPWDTYFRVRVVGTQEVDPLDPAERRRLLFSIAEDLAKHGATPELLRPDTHKLIYGDLPNAVLDFEQSHSSRKAYAKLEPMFYRLADLIRTIKQQRAFNGQTITECMPDSYLTPEELERSRCRSLARPLWKIIVERTHPEWLRRNDVYCQSGFFSFDRSYEWSESTRRRKIIGAAVISDEVVYDIYDESVRTGVKGIGPKGRGSLRELLCDEHPELI